MVRSARLAFLGSRSVTRARWGGMPGLVKASARSTAVPLLAATCPAGTTSVLLSSFAMVPVPLVRLGREPDGEGHDRAEAEDPEEEPLGDRAEAPQLETADARVRLRRLDGRDDVGLVLG